MGEITSLIEDVQKDKDQFAKLEQAMEPLINKYMGVRTTSQPPAA